MLEPSQTVYIGLRRGASCSCGSASRASPSSIPKSIIALGRPPYHCPKGRGGGSGRSARTRLTPGEEGGELRRPEDSLGQRTRHALDALHRSVKPPRTNARRRPGAIGMRSRPDRDPRDAAEEPCGETGTAGDYACVDDRVPRDHVARGCVLYSSVYRIDLWRCEPEGR